MSLLSRLARSALGRAFFRIHYGISRNSATAQILRHSFLEELRREPRYRDRKRLSAFEHKAFSQNGEDGIIREIFRRIGNGGKTFVEIGVGDGLENNTTLLLHEGWRGLWIEGDAKNCRAIATHFARPLETGQIVLRNTIVTRDNVVGLVADGAPPGEVDLLSIDVDRNTYYIWQALGNLKPRVVVVEYNSVFPADMAWVVDYADKSWNGTTHYGASLKAYELLGERLGYRLVGCDITGTNAFFVRADLCADLFCDPFTSENHYEPDRHSFNQTKRRAFSD